MKRFLVIGIIAILVIVMLIVLAIKRTENNTVVNNATNSVVESAIENDANTTDEAVSDNGDVDTYGTLLLDEDVYDKDGAWTSNHFSIPDDANAGINLYYQNNGKRRTEVRLYEIDNSGRYREIFSFIVSPGDRAVRNPYVQRNYSYYVKVVSIGGGSVEGNLRVASR